MPPRSIVTVCIVRAARGSGQDRAIVHRLDGGIVLAVADGAGGTGGGAEAAAAVIDAVASTDDADTPWAGLLATLDVDPARLAHGQTTAVVASITPRGIAGASVGDSEAWLVRGSQIEVLTRDQQRKPLVGDGCSPVAFTAGPLGDATLLLGSDGLFKYVRRDAILAALTNDVAVAAEQLLAHATRTAGELQDDIAIVIARATS